MFDPTNDFALEKSTITGRWLLKGFELTCGSCIEVNIDGHWIRTVIECDVNGYYAIPISVNLHYGLWARFLGD
jgi:hypothetical protein